MRKSDSSKKRIYFMVWILNIGASLGIGQALCQYFKWSVGMRLVPIVLGIILSLSLTLVMLKKLEIIQFMPLALIQSLYWSTAFYSMAYQEIYGETESKSLLDRYFSVSIVVSIIILGIIIFGIIGLSYAYKRLKKKFHTSNTEQLNSLYYYSVLPKAIMCGGVFVVGYLIVIKIINEVLFSEVEAKSFCIAMSFIAVGVSCFSFTIAIIVSKLIRKN